MRIPKQTRDDCHRDFMRWFILALMIMTLLFLAFVRPAGIIISYTPDQVNNNGIVDCHHDVRIVLTQENINIVSNTGT